MLKRAFFLEKLIIAMHKLKSFIVKEWLLLLSALVHFTIQLILAWSYYNPIDFVLQYEAALKIANGYLLYRDIDKIPLGESFLPRPQYPPLYLYSLGLLFYIVGPNNVTWHVAKLFLVIINILVGFLIYYLVYLCFSNYHKRKVMALLAFNWFLINPSTLGVIIGGYHDNYMLLFVLLAYIYLFKGKSNISGLLLGMATLVKPIAIVFFLPTLIMSYQFKNKSYLWSWVIGGMTFFAASLPFLILAGRQYIEDVFLVHTTRLDPNMSLVYTTFTSISQTVIPFVLQILSLLVILLLFVKKVDLTVSNDTMKISILRMVTPLSSAFLLFNRISYPHYVPWIFPFLCFSMVSTIVIRPSGSIPSIKILIGLFIGLLLVYIGSFGWSMVWFFGGFSEDPLFVLFSQLYSFGLLIITIVDIKGIIDAVRHQ